MPIKERHQDNRCICIIIIIIIVVVVVVVMQAFMRSTHWIRLFACTHTHIENCHRRKRHGHTLIINLACLHISKTRDRARGVKHTHTTAIVAQCEI